MKSVANQKTITRQDSYGDHSRLDQKTDKLGKNPKGGSGRQTICNSQNTSGDSEDNSSNHSFGVQDFSRISILPSSIFPIQTKLKINKPGDKYEQEADEVAEQVMRMPTQTLQRKCSKCGKKEEIKKIPGTTVQRKCAKCEHEEKLVQTKSNGDSRNVASTAFMNQIQNTKGGGQAMDGDTRLFMEPRFGMDFSKVRIHTDSNAAGMSQEINAKAFTVGKDIYFNRGAYNPGGMEGKKLLAHELTHVVQQNGSTAQSLHSSSSFLAQKKENGVFPFVAGQISQNVGDYIQRICEGSIETPANGYGSRAAANLRCDERNTGLTDVTERITRGRRAAMGMVHNATSALQLIIDGNGSRAVIDQFKRAFGLNTDPTPAQIRHVLRVYGRMCVWLTSNTVNRGSGILCLPHTSFRCTQIGGSAVCGTNRPMNLCSNSISSHGPTTAETIIHELAHRFGVCTSNNVAETYEGGENFPTPEAINTSADSYSMFAREVHSISVNEQLGDERPIGGIRGFNLEQ